MVNEDMQEVGARENQMFVQGETANWQNLNTFIGI